MAMINYKAAPTASRFHRSTAFVRGLRGPIGTGKSVTCCMEIIRRAVEQTAFCGVRSSRWAVIRNSYPELKSTSIKTWEDWVPDAVMRWDAPITSMVVQNLPDGTRVELEVMFISLDRPDDVKKLKSLELTGIWINECSELPKAILDMGTGRVGRYPSLAQGGSNWSGIIMDTNSPDDDHWYYKMAEVDKPEGYEFFAQPGALLKVGESYIPNPDAENVSNHTLGYEYWLRQIPGKDAQWIKVFVLGEYGSVHDGKPVYGEYNDTLHVKQVNPIPNVQLRIGMDFGLTPAAVITQTDSRGRLLVLDEMCGEDMAIDAFLTDMLIPQLMSVYPDFWKRKDDLIICIGDPAGNQKSQQSNEKTCLGEVRAAGLKIRPGKTNAWLPRRSAVAWFLSKLSGGQPMMLIDPCCAVLRKGFNGGYKYRRIQVVGEERYTEEPMKNSYSHIHDALQYCCMETGGLQAGREDMPKQRGRSRREVLDSVVGI